MTGAATSTVTSSSIPPLSRRARAPGRARGREHRGRARRPHLDAGVHEPPEPRQDHGDLVHADQEPEDVLIPRSSARTSAPFSGPVTSHGRAGQDRARGGFHPDVDPPHVHLGAGPRGRQQEHDNDQGGRDGATPRGSVETSCCCSSCARRARPTKGHPATEPWGPTTNAVPYRFRTRCNRPTTRLDPGKSASRAPTPHGRRPPSDHTEILVPTGRSRSTQPRQQTAAQDRQRNPTRRRIRFHAARVYPSARRNIPKDGDTPPPPSLLQPGDGGLRRAESLGEFCLRELGRGTSASHRLDEPERLVLGMSFLSGSGSLYSLLPCLRLSFHRPAYHDQGYRRSFSDDRIPRSRSAGFRSPADRGRFRPQTSRLRATDAPSSRRPSSPITVHPAAATPRPTAPSRRAADRRARGPCAALAVAAARPETHRRPRQAPGTRRRR